MGSGRLKTMSRAFGHVHLSSACGCIVLGPLDAWAASSKGVPGACCSVGMTVSRLAHVEMKQALNLSGVILNYNLNPNSPGP